MKNGTAKVVEPGDHVGKKYFIKKTAHHEKNLEKRKQLYFFEDC